MLRHIARKSRVMYPLPSLKPCITTLVATSTLRRQYASDSKPQPTPSSPSPSPSSLTPPTPSSPTTPTPIPTPASSSPPSPPNPTANKQHEGRQEREERGGGGGGGGGGLLLLNLLVILGLGGYGYYQWQQDPDYPYKVKKNVSDAVHYVQAKLASLSSSPSPPPPPPPSQKPPVVEPILPPTPPPIPPTPSPVGREVEIIEVIAPPSSLPPLSPSDEPLPPLLPLPPSEETVSLPHTLPPPLILDEPAMLIIPEEVVARVENDIDDVVPPEIVRELFEKGPVPLSLPHTSELQEALKEQAAQIEYLKTRLTEFESSRQQQAQQAFDYQAQTSQATEQAYREVLALHDRIHRKDLASRLDEVQKESEQRMMKTVSELKAQYEAQLAKEKANLHAQFQQQYEKDKTDLQRSMDESLKAALETAHAQYSVRLAEEINKFDSKLMAEIQNEDAKYSHAFNERMHAIAKLRTEILGLEASLNANSARLKEVSTLHDVSAAVFDLGLALSSPARTSFVNELDKLETANKTLGSDSVITTVAEVLRPIAAGGIVPYNELSDRFKTVVANGRQAALVPEGGGIVGNLVAAVASKLIIPAKGPAVQGDSPEAIFAKAEYYFEHGELNEAVTQLAQLRGMPLSIARDWLQAASDRLVLENSVKALHSHIVVLAHQQGSK